ncbi:MAG: hypothetical protein P4L16_06375 [Chlamydiales bacterium]|nr:hypothetical protein [Chlamydiales bacterium]
MITFNSQNNIQTQPETHAPVSSAPTATTSYNWVIYLLGLKIVALALFSLRNIEPFACVGNKLKGWVRNICTAKSAHDSAPRLTFKRVVVTEDVKARSDNERARQRCEKLQATINVLKQNIESFDSFVQTHPELLALFKKYMKEQPFAIASIIEVPGDGTMETSLGLQRIHLEHRINERTLFVKRYKEITDWLEAYVNAHEDSKELRKQLLPCES